MQPPGKTGARSRPRTSDRKLSFLFATLGHIESDFYGRVGAELAQRGHSVSHITFSRAAARRLQRAGFPAQCLPDMMAALGPVDVDREAVRIAGLYDTPTFRDIYRTDFVCDGKPERWCLERTVRHVLAIERFFEEHRPDIVIPEVGNETIRTATHLIGLRRGLPVLFLFYTIFPDPLRLYVDTMHAPITPLDRVRDLAPAEAQAVEEWIAAFKRRDEPIREYRTFEASARRARIFARHMLNELTVDRDNDYLRPGHWLLSNARDAVRSRAARRYYEPHRPERPYVYFPLHVVDDYKLKRIIPHCVDQPAIVEQVARSLPHGYDLLVKEHPMSIGRNSLRMLHKFQRMRNVQLVEPHTSSHGLIEHAEAVAVISSTVGLEALLYDKPVLTMGEPFYSGYGITVDLDGPVDLRTAVPELLDFKPDPAAVRRFLHAAMQECMPGAPVLVDRSQENAVRLAGSLEQAGRAHARPGVVRSTSQRRAAN